MSTRWLLVCPDRLEEIGLVVEYWERNDGERFATVITEWETFMNIELSRLRVVRSDMWPV